MGRFTRIKITCLSLVEQFVMFFNIIPWSQIDEIKPENSVQLRKDRWDDFGYKTQFYLVYIDTSGKFIEIGDVKIAEFQEQEGFSPSSPALPESFDSLDENFFSIGQSESYYQNLNKLGSEIRDKILFGLQDLAKNPTNLDKALEQRMMTVSLMRSVGIQSIKGRFHRLARGDASLTAYKFSFTAPTSIEDNIMTLSFEVVPYSEPPTNIHVLIGRNGVGKTYLLTNMMLSIITEENSIEKFGIVEADASNKDEGLFENLISVSFSAFDPFNTLPLPKTETSGMRYSYIGLKKFNEEVKSWDAFPKDIQSLTQEFVDSVEACLLGGKLDLLQAAVEILSSDPMFDMIGLIELVTQGKGLRFVENRNTSKIDEDTVKWYEQLTTLFSGLSSGHKIVLLTITRLVEDVVERTLVLIDEPESHLHPPLLSAFIRTLSDLLIRQNGVAILATHSPVVVQEVPKSCVWKLRRSNLICKADRPLTETFGENVGVLTRDIFGLEVTESGFHKMLQDAVAQYNDYSVVLNHFNGHLGAEAKAIVQGLLLTKDKTI
jgi:hypothetical protein